MTKKIDFECQILALFDTSQFSKFNKFLWVFWFLGKTSSDFFTPIWKLLNPYCHRYWPGGSHPHLFWNLVNTNRISTNKRKYLAEKTRKGNKLHIPMCVSQFCISNFLSDLLQNCRFIHVYVHIRKFPSITVVKQETSTYQEMEQNLRIFFCICLLLKSTSLFQHACSVIHGLYVRCMWISNFFTLYS